TDYNLLLLLLFISGTGVALYLPTAISFLSEIFSQKKRGVYIGIHETALPIGRAVGPILVGLALFWGLGWRGSIQVFFILPILSLTTQLVFMREPAIQQTQEGSQLTRSDSFKFSALSSYTPFILLLGATTCHGVGDTFLSLMPLYWTHDFGIEIATAALIVGLTRFSGAIGHIAAGYLSDVFGRLRILLSISFFSVVLMIGSAYLPISAFLIVSLLGYSILFDAYYPVLWVYVADITPPKERTKMLGFLLAIYGILGAINPVIIGFLAENFGFKIAWIYPIALSALGFMFFLALRARFKGIT
ncbi:MAG: MFS transporter, partial [Candidatus Hodarchaeota archaeon]